MFVSTCVCFEKTNLSVHSIFKMMMVNKVVIAFLYFILT